MAKTLEGELTQEDIDKVANLVYEATRKVCGQLGGLPRRSIGQITVLVEFLRPYAKNRKPRLAVMFGSNCRKLPAAALRGLTNNFSPCARAVWLIISKA